jgi:MFS superfamily sulfate permease-like transporter
LQIPGLFLALAAATIVVALFDLNVTAGVKVLGDVPHGLPSLALPWINADDLTPILIGGFAAALLAFADTSVLSRSYAAKYNMYVDPNRELIGLGVANLAGGLFRGFSVSGSPSRTSVAVASGAKTQLTCALAAIVVALLPVLAPNLMQDLPASASAAVVMSAAVTLFEFGDLRRIYRVQRWEFWLSMVCFAGVAVFGAIPGIGLAIGIALIEFLWNAWRPYSTTLGRVEGMRGYYDVRRFPSARQIPGLILFRWDAPLFFANAELFQRRLLDAVASSPAPIRRVVVTAEPISRVDVTSADMLEEVEQKLRASGIELRFAELRGPVQDSLQGFELLDRLGPVQPTLDAVVEAYLADHKVEWKP